MLRERFLERGTEQSVSSGTIFSSDDDNLQNKVWFVISGKVLYKIYSNGNLLAEFECFPDSIAGIVEVCAPHTIGGVFQVLVLEDSLLYSWDRQQFSYALGIYQELATKVIKRLSYILRKVNHLVSSSASSDDSSYGCDDSSDDSSDGCEVLTEGSDSCG